MRPSLWVRIVPGFLLPRGKPGYLASRYNSWLKAYIPWASSGSEAKGAIASPTASVRITDHVRPKSSERYRWPTRAGPDMKPPKRLPSVRYTRPG